MYRAIQTLNNIFCSKTPRSLSIVLPAHGAANRAKVDVTQNVSTCGGACCAALTPLNTAAFKNYRTNRNRKTLSKWWLFFFLCVFCFSITIASVILIVTTKTIYTNVMHMYQCTNLKIHDKHLFPHNNAIVDVLRLWKKLTTYTVLWLYAVCWGRKKSNTSFTIDVNI